MPVKKQFNYLLSLISLTITYLALELILPFLLNHVPLTMYNALQNEIRALGQSSKNSVIPKDYIALVGDSYAQGLGDWLKNNIKNSRYKGTNPDYYSGHVIYNQTGIDVITYGMGGAGSIKGLVTAPIIPHTYINSLWPYTLDQPKQIIIYFYEGNDFTDNSLYYTNRFLFKGHDESYYFKGYNAASFYDSKYFDQYLQKEALERYPSYNNQSPLRHLIFTSLMQVGWNNLQKETTRAIKRFKSLFYFNEKDSMVSFKPGSIQILKISLNKSSKPNSSPKNIAIINGEKITLPAYLQGPPVTLSPEQIKRSLYIFERSLLFMARFFSKSKISIIYIPGPASIYSMVGPNISFEAGEGRLASKETISNVSQEGCAKIHRIAKKHGFKFLDTRPYLQEHAKRKILHGPEDHQHLNRAGQTLLAELIIQHILGNQQSKKINPCIKQTY